MKPLRAVLAAAAAAAVASLAAPPPAQSQAKERGNIVSVDWQAMQVEIKDPKNHVRTWKVRHDAQVVFTDKKSEFPNPKLTDLRAPMYVYFTFDYESKQISRFEVREVGFEPAKGGPGTPQDATITNLDAAIGHVEVNLPTGTKTFEVDPKAQLRNFKIGDRVTILIERREGNREVVTVIKRR